MFLKSANLYAQVKLTMLIAVLLLVAGCSSSADYKDSIGDLKSALDSSILTISAIDQKVTKAKNDEWRAGIVATPPTAILESKDKNCAIGTAGCALQVLGGDEKPVDFPLPSVLVKSRAGLAALKSYVGNLKAIVDADTAGKISTHTNSALASLTKLEAEIAKVKGDAPKKGLIAAYAEPAGNLFVWAVEQYVERVKVRALAAATRRAHPAIMGLDNLTAGVGDSAALLEFSGAHKTFIVAKTEYQGKEDAGTLSVHSIGAYINAAAAYDQALKASAAKPLAAFTRAHEKLKCISITRATSLWPTPSPPLRI